MNLFTTKKIRATISCATAVLLTIALFLPATITSFAAGDDVTAVVQHVYPGSSTAVAGVTVAVTADSNANILSWQQPTHGGTTYQLEKVVVERRRLELGYVVEYYKDTLDPANKLGEATGTGIYGSVIPIDLFLHKPVDYFDPAEIAEGSLTLTTNGQIVKILYTKVAPYSYTIEYYMYPGSGNPISINTATVHGTGAPGSTIPIDISRYTDNPSVLKDDSLVEYCDEDTYIDGSTTLEFDGQVVRVVFDLWMHYEIRYMTEVSYGTYEHLTSLNGKCRRGETVAIQMDLHRPESGHAQGQLESAGSNTVYNQGAVIVVKYGLYARTPSAPTTPVLPGIVVGNAQSAGLNIAAISAPIVSTGLAPSYDSYYEWTSGKSADVLFEAGYEYVITYIYSSVTTPGEPIIVEATDPPTTEPEVTTVPEEIPEPTVPEEAPSTIPEEFEEPGEPVIPQASQPESDDELDSNTPLGDLPYTSSLGGLASLWLIAVPAAGVTALVMRKKR